MVSDLRGKLIKVLAKVQGELNEVSPLQKVNPIVKSQGYKVYLNAKKHVGFECEITPLMSWDIFLAVLLINLLLSNLVLLALQSFQQAHSGHNRWDIVIECQGQYVKTSQNAIPCQIKTQGWKKTKLLGADDVKYWDMPHPPNKTRGLRGCSSSTRTSHFVSSFSNNVKVNVKRKNRLTTT